MPTVKYYSRSVKYVQNADTGKRERVECMKCETARVKSVEDLKPIAAKKSFLRWRTGNFSIEDIVQRRKALGRSDWYV